MPDTKNLLLISKLFSVSTDYLLHDNYNDDTDIPIVKQTAVYMQKEQKLKSAYLITLGGLSISFLLGLCLWTMYQNTLSILLSSIGDILFIVFFKLCIMQFTDHRLELFPFSQAFFS